MALEQEMTRLEAMTESLLEKRANLYNNSASAIATNFIGDIAVSLVAMAAVFMILSIWFGYSPLFSAQTGGTVAILILLFSSVIKYFADEFLLSRSIFLLGKLSERKKIIILNNAIAALTEKLEQTGAVGVTALKQEIFANAKAYYSGLSFPVESQSFIYLYDKGLAKLDNDGNVVLIPNDLHNLFEKLQNGQ